MNPSRITTTVGLNIGKIDVDGIQLNFWDLGGQLELQSLWDKVPGLIYSFKRSFNSLFVLIYVVNGSQNKSNYNKFHHHY